MAEWECFLLNTILAFSGSMVNCAMEQLKNEQLAVAIKPKGAELCSVKGVKNGLEYMWQADPAVWGKHSPVLFPFVGTLKNDTYFFDHKAYAISRHGFARDREFMVESRTSNEIVFLLASNADTKAVYPFDFEFRIRYQLEKDTLYVTYEVSNTGTNRMFFSVGGHPAFALPLEKGAAYNDYQLVFETAEEAGRWPIMEGGLIGLQPDPLLDNSTILPLTKELFSKDALVFKDLRSSVVSLRSDTYPHGWTFDFTDFPYLGLWAAKGGDFVCVEPWCGIADSVAHNQQLETKEGIQSLLPEQAFSRTWSVCFW